MIDKAEETIAGILPLLAGLDRLLAQAVAAADAAYGADAAADPYRGLYINEKQVSALLGLEPLSSPLRMQTGLGLENLPEDSRLSWLRGVYGLSEFDTAVLVIAL